VADLIPSDGGRGADGRRGPKGNQGDQGNQGNQGNPGRAGPVDQKSLLFYLGMAIVVVALFARVESIVYSTCLGSADNRDKIRDSLVRGFTNLGYGWDEDKQRPFKIGPPLLQYYKDNPGEIPAQADRLRQEIDGFPTISCERPFWHVL
jgi:hypothetical protein